MTVRFGVIGLGNRGYKYALRTIATHPNCQLDIVCDQSDRYFDKFPDAIKTKSYQEVLNNPEIDAVFIATPDNTHRDIILEAAKAGKHILCEKPVAITTSELVELSKELKNYSSVIEIGYVLRYARLFQKVHQLLSEDVIGEVIMMNAVDHIHYGGYAFFHDWHRTRKNATSLLLQKATHTLDLLNWYSGSSPKKVVAFGGLKVMGRPGAIKKFGKPVAKGLRCGNCPIMAECEESIQNLKKEKNISWGENWPDSCVFNDEVDVDDHQSVMIEYANGCKVNYQLSQFSPFYKREFQLIGSKGELHFDDVSNTIKIFNRLKPENTTIKIEYQEMSMEPGDEEQLQDFIDSIMFNREPISNLKTGIDAGALALAAQESIDKERLVFLNVD